MASTPEKKLSKVFRQILSFILFVAITLIVLASCTRAVALDRIRIENAFTSNICVSGVRDNLIDYAKDTYARNGLDRQNLDSIFDYNDIKEVVKAYIACNLHSSVGYNEDTYNDLIKDIVSAYTDDLNKQIKSNDAAVKELSSSFESYVKEEIALGAIDSIEKILNVGSVASLVICIVGVFFAVSSALILFFIGNKRYRNIRAIGNSLMSAGIFNILFVLMAVITLKIKHIDIYPQYLADIFAKHFSVFTNSIMSISGILIIFAIIIYTIVWKMKKG